MSLSPTGTGSTGGDIGGTEIEAAIRQMIEAYLLGANITSAGGDSPKINKIETLPEVPAFGDILANAVQIAVIRHMEDSGIIGNIGDGDIVPKESGLTEGQAVGIARKGVSTLQNPASLVAEGLGLLPHAVVASFVISILPIIINELTKPGGPFDLRFKRMVEKEFNSLQDRQTSFDLAIGERGLVIQSRAGFLNRHGASSNTNTLRMIREGELNRDNFSQVDYTDHAKGLF